MWSNFCVTDAFEPGSVVKPIVMSGALEKGKITVNDTFNCDGGETFGAMVIPTLNVRCGRMHMEQKRSVKL